MPPFTVRSRHGGGAGGRVANQCVAGDRVHRVVRRPLILAFCVTCDTWLERRGVVGLGFGGGVGPRGELCPHLREPIRPDMPTHGRIAEARSRVPG